MDEIISLIFRSLYVPLQKIISIGDIGYFEACKIKILAGNDITSFIQKAVESGLLVETLNDLLLIWMSDSNTRHFFLASSKIPFVIFQQNIQWEETLRVVCLGITGNIIMAHPTMIAFLKKIIAFPEYAVLMDRFFRLTDHGIEAYACLKDAIRETFRFNSGVHRLSFRQKWVPYQNTSWKLSDEILNRLPPGYFDSKAVDFPLARNPVLDLTNFPDGIITDQPDVYFGRSLVYGGLIVKIMKAEETAEMLALESQKAIWLGENIPELGISGFESHGQVVFKTTLENLKVHADLFCEQLDKGEFFVHATLGHVFVIAYRIPVENRDAFLTYFEDIPWKETKLPFIRCMCQMAELAKRGLFHESLTTLPQFHHISAGREWLWNIGSGKVSFHREAHHSGELSNCLAFGYSNLRQGWIADVGHILSLRELDVDALRRKS